jgi:hypothetical protein
MILTLSHMCSVRLDIDAWMAEAAEEAANPELAAQKAAQAAAAAAAKEKRRAPLAEGRPRKKSKLELAEPVKKKEVAPKPDFVCVLCPDLSNEMLLRVADVGDGDEPPSGNKNPKMAHKICVSDRTCIDVDVVQASIIDVGVL